MDEKFMKVAIEMAMKSRKEGGIPIGSVLVHHDKIISKGHNQRIQKGSCILHAEMDALENAGRLSAKMYQECAIYTTLSPCAMCSGAIILYQIPTVVIGENLNFLGSEKLLKNQGIEVRVLQDEQCIEMMRRFIKEQPHLWNEDIGL